MTCMPGWMKKQNGAVAADWRQLERLYRNAVVDTKPSGREGRKSRPVYATR